jgi:hypothetical protein
MIYREGWFWTYAAWYVRSIDGVVCESNRELVQAMMEDDRGCMLAIVDHHGQLVPAESYSGADHENPWIFVGVSTASGWHESLQLIESDPDNLPEKGFAFVAATMRETQVLINEALEKARARAAEREERRKKRSP